MTEADPHWLSAVGSGHPPGEFRHREHLRLAWLELERSASLGEAMDEVSRIIFGIASAQGVPQKYNRTVTDGWVRIVRHFRDSSGARTFADLLERCPQLLDKRLLMRHFTSRTLAGEAARRGWVEPDVRPIPA